MKLYSVLILLLIGSLVNGQNISGVVNTYHKVTAINTTTNALTLSSAAGLSPGVKVLIIQMKGATIDNTNTATFGNITALSNAGNYEFNYVCGVNGNDILLVYGLQRTYTIGGLVQLVTVPRYTDAVVTDTLKAAAWNPVSGTGGILAIEAVNSITLLAPIDAEGAGFKGGTYLDHPEPPFTCDWATKITNFYLADPPASPYLLGGSKGEGITPGAAAMSLGKGKLANGGGGANNHNSGGAGGSNYAAGGDGGLRSNEGFFTCHGQNPGIGGLALSGYGYSGANNRVFLGGGGGAGQGNNNVGMPGANGGGIIFILTATLNGNNQLVRANGARPYRGDLADPYSAGGDGGGGGGGGGVVVLNINNYAGNVNVQAQGGNGSYSSYTPSSGCFGPGGGGGGGVVWVKSASLNPLVNASVAGGTNGLISVTTSVVACRGLANSAAPGSNGAVLTSYTPVASASLVCAPLPASDLVNFTGKEINAAVELNWKMRSIANIHQYQVQRSVDNVNYSVVNIIAYNQQYNFSLTDKEAPAGYVYYRLKIVYADGSSLYSRSVTVYIKNHELQLLRLSPNPAGNNMTLVIKTAVQGNCEVDIYNNSAQKLVSKNYMVRSGINQLQLQLSQLPPGVYYLHIRQDGQRVLRSFVKTDQP